jgi:dienelactone hydrolase
MITTRDIEYEADGRAMVGHLALPDGDDRRPGVLVAHEAPGLDETYRDRAERLAEEGYVAFALDLHGGGQPIADRQEAMARVGQLLGDPLRLRDLGRAGLGVLLAEPRVDTPRVAAIGYCLGGALALELARAGTDLAAVVAFHPGLRTTHPAPAGAVRAAVLVCIGADDPIIPLDHRVEFEAEMRASGTDWRMNVYGGALHSFTNPRAALIDFPGVAYHAGHAERAWRAMHDLFDEAFS